MKRFPTNSAVKVTVVTLIRTHGMAILRASTLQYPHAILTKAAKWSWMSIAMVKALTNYAVLQSFANLKGKLAHMRRQ